MQQPEEESSTKQGKPSRNLKRGLLMKELPTMMYGFGDDKSPALESVAVMEEILIDYITDVCLSAHRLSASRGKIKIQDFKFALRRDPKKLSRIDELLFMQDEIARASGKNDILDLAQKERENMLKQNNTSND